MGFMFSEYFLDVDRRELRSGGAAVPLAPQVFDLLLYLLRNRDRVVTKDDLLEAVWGGRIVSESALTTRINWHFPDGFTTGTPGQYVEPRMNSR